MFEALSALMSPVFGRRESSLSVPILDGALKPNNLLEEASIVAEDPALEDIAIGSDGMLYAACGSNVCRVSADGGFEPVAKFEQLVTALAFLPDGVLAVGLGNRVVFGAGGATSRVIEAVDGEPLNAVNALHADSNGSLWITDGSRNAPYAQWSRDLMEKGRSGRLLRYDRASGKAEILASGLGYAFGACVDKDDRVLVSESWRHRVDGVTGAGDPTPCISSLPGYPARMSPAAGGGFWLTLFACRTQLVEFVLRENDYRRDMMKTIEPEYWISPALSSGNDFLEPLQGGGVKQMGILKPWAPSRSYGLVVRYDSQFNPVCSLHSRVGGRHHGVVAVAQRGDDLFVLSKGAGRLLQISVSGIEPARMLNSETGSADA